MVHKTRRDQGQRYMKASLPLRQRPVPQESIKQKQIQSKRDIVKERDEQIDHQEMGGI